MPEYTTYTDMFDFTVEDLFDSERMHNWGYFTDPKINLVRIFETTPDDEFDSRLVLARLEKTPDLIVNNVFGEKTELIKELAKKVVVVEHLDGDQTLFFYTLDLDLLARICLMPSMSTGTVNTFL
ncbi:hypothetical protein LC612_31090 [Nostoc sp. CHAB 5834]|nr:hypothetical protein [Nostoc sp. CHAB 5834]